MSTKTSIKRIALVAVSALGFGLVAVAPTQAAPAIAYTTMVDTTNGKQIIGGLATVTITPDANATYKVTLSGATSTLWNMTETDAGDALTLNGVDQDLNGNFTDVQLSVADEVDFDSTLAITFTSASAGAATVSIAAYGANGVLGTATTKTVTFVAASTLDLASVQVSTLPGNDAANCTLANKANAAHNSITYQDSDDVANADATDIDICVLAFAGTGALKTGTNITVASNGKGLVGGTAVVASAADADGIFQTNVTGNGLSGAGVFTVTVSSTNQDGTTTTLSGTVTINFYGELATLTLAHTKKAIDDDAGAATDVLTVAALDENGFNFPLDLTNAAELLVDSDIASTVVIDTPGEEDAAAAITTGDAVISVKGAVTTAAKIALNPVDASYEAVTVTAVVTNADGKKVTSNSLVVYITDSASLTPTVSVADGVAGASQTVSATVKADITGKDYPVADGETVTFGTSGGSFSATTATTSGGVASTTLYNSAISGDYTASATADTLVGTKSFKVTGGLGDTVEAAVDAAAEAIDAANAATDAANLAAEAADAATVAAEEARDAADAATAAVEELATQVATLMAALKAQITTLANTVAKIAKKVRA